VRRLGLSDLHLVMRIDAECMPTPWGERIWREELSSPFGAYLALEEDGEVVGQIGVKRVADEMHVVTIAVRPEHRRQGHARSLLEAAFAFYPGVSRVYLEVRPSNTPARALYESLGFEEGGRRPGYYGDEDALLMTLDLADPR
jgi:ribosomal-protein-alanine N-acetyltransferase